MRASTSRALCAATLFVAPLACRDSATDLTAPAPVPRSVGPLMQTMQSSTVVFRSDSSNRFASACWQDAGTQGCVGLTTSLEEGGPRTFLGYFIQVCTPSDSVLRATDTASDSTPGDSVPPPAPPQCRVVEDGFGLVPSGDVMGAGTQVRSLRTNTSAESNPDFIRLVGSGGIVSIDWRATSDSAVRFHTAHNERFGDLVFHFNGTSVFAPATATGSAVGTPLAGTVSASLGRSQAVTVVVDRGS